MGAALLAAGGCKRKSKTRPAGGAEETGLASVVHVADPRTAQQLLRGFHEVEQNAWRWTKGRFAVTLRPPAAAAERGAVLNLKFALPEPILDRVKTATLTANVNGTAIPPETFNKGGDYSYRRDVPPEAMKGEAVTVEFAVDNFVPAGAIEPRELAIIVSSVGLEAK